MFRFERHVSILLAKFSLQEKRKITFDRTIKQSTFEMEPDALEDSEAGVGLAVNNSHQTGEETAILRSL